jgi:hypothetical protein
VLPPRAAARREHSSQPTSAQALCELERRRLPRDRRGEGREQAVRDGTFFLSTAELRAIAHADETFTYDQRDRLLRRRT